MLQRFIFFIILCLSATGTRAQPGEREADLKAAFIYNFTRYIDWDTNKVKEGFVIGIISSSPVAAALAEVAKTNTIKNKKIIIKVFDKPEEIGDCNILFIPRNTPFQLQSILERVGKGTLTISEETGYARLGTALNFIIVNDKLKFEANLKAIDSAALNAGSQLLKLAIIID